MSVLDDFDDELEKRVNKKVQSIVKSQEDNDDGAGNVKDFSKQELDKDKSDKKEAAKAAKEKDTKEGDKVEQETKDANKKPMDKTEHKSLDKLEVKSLNINGKEFDDFIKKSVDEKVNKSLDDLNSKIDNDSTKTELEKSIQIFVKSFKAILDNQDKITSKQDEIAKSLKEAKPAETKETEKSLSTPKEKPVDKSASYAAHDSTSTVEDHEKEVNKSIKKDDNKKDILKGLDMNDLWDKFNVRMAKNIKNDEFSAEPLKTLSGNVYYHTANEAELKKFVDFANGKDIQLY